VPVIIYSWVQSVCGMTLTEETKVIGETSSSPSIMSTINHTRISLGSKPERLPQNRIVSTESNKTVDASY